MFTSPDLESLLLRLPAHWALAPIYRKGKQGSTDGKKPVNKSRTYFYDAQECITALRAEPDDLGAVGVWLGSRSQGLVCLDIDDENGEAILRAMHGPDALPDTFVVRSPKKGRGKYFYYVPSEYWGSACTRSLKHTGGVYELLWNSTQAIIAGAYGEGGYYEWSTDVENVVDAPQWLIRELVGEKEASFLPEGFSTQTQLSDEEKILIVRNALEALPNEDLFYDDYFAVACAVHDALPDERGLGLFEAWSAKSGKHQPGYVERHMWRYIRHKEKGYHLGSLIFWCRERGYDPVPQELQERVSETIQQRTKEKLEYEDILERMNQIHQQEDPGKVLWDLQQLGKTAGIGVKSLLAIYENFLAYQTGGAPTAAPDYVAAYDPDKFSFVIPDLLAQGIVVLLHGESDAGKTYFAYNIAKAVLEGSTFRGYKARRGTVLVLQSDENPTITSQRIMQLGLQHQRNLIFVRGWQFSHELRLKSYLEKYQPSLCIIDSLSSCNSASMVSENDSSYAQPLYRLTGAIAPTSGCSFLVLHHDNKGGDFRGSSAIKAAVDEMWHLRKPTNQDGGLDFRTQRILKISKSRTQVSGEWVGSFDPDTSLYTRWEEFIGSEMGVSEEDQTPATPQERIRAWFESRMEDRYWKVSDLQGDFGLADIGPGTIRSAVHRLYQRGLLERLAYGQRDLRYRAVERASAADTEETPAPTSLEEHLDLPAPAPESAEGFEEFDPLEFAPPEL